MTLPKLPRKLTGLSSRFSRMFTLSHREAVVIAVSLSVVLVAALIITIITLTVSGKSTAIENDKKTAGIQEIGSNLPDRPFLSDFIIYEDNLEKSLTGVIYSREPLEQWPDEEIEKYWIDPKLIAADQLEIEAETIIRDIFADVP